MSMFFGAIGIANNAMNMRNAGLSNPMSSTYKGKNSQTTNKTQNRQYKKTNGNNDILDKINKAKKKRRLEDLSDTKYPKDEYGNPIRANIYWDLRKQQCYCPICGNEMPLKSQDDSYITDNRRLLFLGDKITHHREGFYVECNCGFKYEVRCDFDDGLYRDFI